MHHDFTAASFGRHLVLYDPAAIPDGFPFDSDTETPEPDSPPAEALRELSAAGNGLVIEIPEGDCEATIRLTLDEPLPLDGNRHARTLLGSTLNVPSGTLTADGAEFIHPAPKARKHSDAHVVNVPCGRYHLEVLDQIAWKEANRDSYVESRTTQRGRHIAKAVDYFTFSWVVLFVSTILIIPGIIVLLWVNLGRDVGMVGIGVTVAIHAAYLVAFAALEWASARWLEIDQATVAQCEFDRENPDIVVALRLLDSVGHESTPAFMIVDAVPPTNKSLKRKGGRVARP